MIKDPSIWWQDRKDELINLYTGSSPIVVYNEETLNDLFFDLLSLDSVDRHLYPVRMNPYPGILKKAFEMGLDFLVGPMEEQILAREACPGITQDRFFFNPAPLSLPKIFVRNRSGTCQENISSASGDIQDYVKEIDRIVEGCPGSEIWFTCGPSDLSHAGVLVMRMDVKTEGRKGFPVTLGEELWDRIGLAIDTPKEIFNLSGIGSDLKPLRYTLVKNPGKGGIECRISASECISKEDVLLIPGIGANQGLGKAPSAKVEVREYLLRARKMCPIRL